MRGRTVRVAVGVSLSLALAPAFAALTSCRVAPPRTPPPTIAETTAAPASVALSAEARAWVDSTLASMTLAEKAAQLVFVRANGTFQNPRSKDSKQLLAQIADLHVGGLVLFASEVETIPRLLDGLQAASKVPLLVSADLERGLSFRVERGTVPLPFAMALGATGSEDAAQFAGEVTAREARAVGIHWALAPVVDVNSNSANPVINIRSFGEDPELVARLSAAFVRGARAGGILTTAKHFPGHGDTAVDSHLSLPVITADRARLEAVEWRPFRRTIEAGVDAIMLGHIAVPALDASGAPATLSPLLARGLLRDHLGFEGLIVTDALEMAGIRPAWTGEATVRAVAAGADALLLPQDPRVAIESLVRAVAEGQLTEARVEESARRLLETKARLGLHRNRLNDRADVVREVARPEDVARADEIALQAVTVVKNEGGILPLAAEKPLSILHLVIPNDAADRMIRGIPEGEIEARGIPVTTRRLAPDIAPETADELAALAARSTHVVVSLFVRAVSSRGRTEIAPAQVALLRRLAASGVPVVALALGSPYVLAQIPEVPAFVCTYGPAESSQRAAIAVLFGEHDTTGKLPVTLPGLSSAGTFGQGLMIPRRAMALSPAAPEEVGFRPGAMTEVDGVVEHYLAAKAFPGAVLAVGRRGKLVHLKAFGKLSYEDDAAPATNDTLYDLASLTKVIATTTMAMILVDEGALALDKPVRDFLPGFTGEGKEKVTVRHLLTHSSGIDWWAPLYQTTRGKAAYLEKIQAMPLVAEPGTVMKYSDLGIILLGEILERVAGMPLDVFVRERVFAPLGMEDTVFRPGPERLPRIAPTELDPWRNKVLRGEVHDENAFALGGVAPHAGLFGTAGDLARFAQMLANGGVIEHRRIVSRKTVELFTRRAGKPADSSRALGWDTKSPEKSSAGTLFSERSFGHTGFTGTSLWIDPERELFVILLTNRVNPTRENNLIREARPAVADAVVRGLDESVRVGLERIRDEGPGPLAGKRVGLLAHAASVTADGAQALNVLLARGVNVVRLFSPEHGWGGKAAAGEAVQGGRDSTSGLPIVSLYGDHTRPTREDLAGLDALVVDLQDAGVRFYTYSSTLLLCLEAAAEAGIELVVLDRPNPLGGERIEGPVSAPRDVQPASLINLAPGPLVHGLTLGELARFANARLAKPARLTVIPMEGWKRRMTWQDTGRPWVPPSPNLRSAEAALAYPGVALLEATNLSEGRGTEAPFLVLGAPWYGPSRLRFETAGFLLRPTTFTPRSSSAAPSPKYRDQICNGFEVEVVDASTAQPYRLGIMLLSAFSGHDHFAWRDEGAALSRLVGTPRLLADLRAGKSLEQILAADDADHRTWREERRPALLYP